MEEKETLNQDQFEEKIADAISGSLSKSLPEAVALAVDEKMKEVGMDNIDAKHGNVPAYFLGKSQEEVDEMSKEQKAAEFVKAVFKKDFATLTSLKAMSEGTDSAGGFLVPEEYAAEINRIAEDFGLVRRFARRISMGTDTMNLPTLTTNVTVSWPGEGTAGTASDLVLGNTALAANTAIGLTVLSNELLADANVDLTRVLAELFGEALAGEEDEQGLVGVGSPFQGILTHGSVNTVVMGSGDTGFTNVSADYLRDMISDIKPLALSGAGFIMHREIWGEVQKLQDGASQYIASLSQPLIGPNANVSGVAGTAVGSIWGYPVYLSEKMPALADTAVSTEFIIFGNLSHLWMGDRQQMSLSISDSATVGAADVFASNQSAVRVTERIALAVGLPTAFTVLVTAAS